MSDYRTTETPTTAPADTAASTDPGDRSAADIERDVERTRAGLTETLDQLRDKLSPGQLVDQVVEYARGSGGADFMRNFGGQVRDNPIPVALIAAGVGWLMIGGAGGAGGGGAAGPRGGAYQPAVSYRGSSRMLGSSMGDPMDSYDSREDAIPRPLDVPTLSDEANDVGGWPSETGSAGSSGAGGTTARARDAVTGAAGRAGEAASSAYRGVAGAAGSAASGIGSAASDAAQRARMAAHDARDAAAHVGSSAYEGAQQGWTRLVQDQPLVLGAIGLAIGAAIGAALPRTSAEDRLMGETSDDLSRQAAAVAREGYEQVSERAGEVVGRVQEVVAGGANAARDRLDRGGVSDAARNAGGTLKEAAGEVSQAVRDAVKEAGAEAKDAVGAAGSGGGAGREGAGRPGQTGGGAAAERRPADSASPSSPRPATGPVPDGSRTNPL